jgi:uncharacterized protein (TIGR02996 family)
MADEQTLLQAVVDSPDEDAPRLAYADWSDHQAGEANQARGEFIRAQIQIAGDGLESLSPSDAYNLQTRVRHLQDRYGATWSAALLPWIESHTFRRGFVELVRMTARSFLDHATDVFALAPVRHVDLTRVRDVTEELFASPYLGRVRSLSMDRCGLYNIHVQLLAASPHAGNLRWLSLEQNNLTLAAPEAIAASEYLKQLRYAEFRGNPVNPAESLGLDGEQVIGSGLPPGGLDLEERFGYLPWLHRFESTTRFGL